LVHKRNRNINPRAAGRRIKKAEPLNCLQVPVT